MGVVVGTTFLLCMGMLLGSLLFLPADVGRHIYYDRAIVIATFIQLPMGSVHTGEMGFCAWMFLRWSRRGMTYRSRAALAAAGILAAHCKHSMRPPMPKVLFLTHVGEPGGAELKMIDLCRAVRGRAEVMLFQRGPLEDILRRD